MTGPQRLSQILESETPDPPGALDPMVIRARAEAGRGRSLKLSRRGPLVAATLVAVLALSLTILYGRGVGDLSPATHGSLTPSVPAFFRTGVQFCGNPYAVNVTTKAGTTPLADCPGLVGLTHPPTITVRVGEQLLFSGIRPGASVTIAPAGLLRGIGALFTAQRSGTAVVTIRNGLCVGGASTCVLMKVHITNTA